MHDSRRGRSPGPVPSVNSNKPQYLILEYVNSCAAALYAQKRDRRMDAHAQMKVAQEADPLIRASR